MLPQTFFSHTTESSKRRRITSEKNCLGKTNRGRKVKKKTLLILTLSPITESTNILVEPNIIEPRPKSN
jgi:hypothetical protein